MLSPLLSSTLRWRCLMTDGTLMASKRLLFLTMALFASGCGISQTPPHEEPPADESQLADGTLHLTPDQVEAGGIETDQVAEREVTDFLTATGQVRIRGGGEARIFAPFAGRLVGATQLPLIGDSLTAGQQIADLEEQFPASERLQLATTAIQLGAAVIQDLQEVDFQRTESTRAQALYEGGAISQRELEKAELALRQAEANLEVARQEMERFDTLRLPENSEPRRVAIRAPIRGTVLRVEAALGQQVDPSMSLLTIADLSTVWIEVNVPERDWMRARDARQARITPPGPSGPSILADLVTVGSSVDPENRTVPFIFSADNRAGILKANMFVEARIPTTTPTTALVVPASALLSEEGADSVYVETQPGVYVRRLVESGQREGDMVVIRAGLEAGERIVSVGAQTLVSESRKAEIPAEAEEGAEAEN